MKQEPKDEVFLKVTSDLARFYALLGHALSFVIENPPQDRTMTLEQVERQFHHVYETLMPRLEGNPVMTGKLKTDYQKAAVILADHKKSGPAAAGNPDKRQEAIRLQSYARERTAAFSDVVAIFRSL